VILFLTIIVMVKSEYCPRLPTGYFKVWGRGYPESVTGSCVIHCVQNCK